MNSSTALNDHVSSLEINGTSLPTTSALSNHQNHNTPYRAISKWLGKNLRVELTDGRSITGILACTDDEPNFILIKAEESWGSQGRNLNSTRLWSLSKVSPPIKTIYNSFSELLISKTKPNRLCDGERKTRKKNIRITYYEFSHLSVAILVLLNKLNWADWSI